MIIHSPYRTLIGDEIQISARIEMANPQARVPKELWFRFPIASRPALDLDPFVVALLLLAMQNNEPIELRGAISKKLFQGLDEYQKIYARWFPERFKPVNISAESLREDSAAAMSVEACAFSGGVDSFYTFLSLLGRVAGEKSRNLTHTIFMAGFDMPLNLTSSIAELTRSYAKMMQEMGIEFIVGSTNVRGFVNTVDWTNAHGQALAATALFFKHKLQKFYIPSSYTDDAYPQWGTHPELDHLLSTEGMEFIHHGDRANRVKKLESVSRAPESYERLRVCWIQDIGLKNCGECEKCVRTMIALEILGRRLSYTTFGTGNLPRTKIRRVNLRTYQSRIFARELMREALRYGRYGIFVDLSLALLRREIFYRTAGVRSWRKITRK